MVVGEDGGQDGVPGVVAGDGHELGGAGDQVARGGDRRRAARHEDGVRQDGAAVVSVAGRRRRRPRLRVETERGERERARQVHDRRRDDRHLHHRTVL